MEHQEVHKGTGSPGGARARAEVEWLHCVCLICIFVSIYFALPPASPFDHGNDAFLFTRTANDPTVFNKGAGQSG